MEAARATLLKHERHRSETDRIAPLIPLIAKRIAEQFNPDKIILFGSRARGDHRPDSDVDLLVILPFMRDRIEVAGAIRESIADIRPSRKYRTVASKDVVVATPEIIRLYGDVGTLVFYHALREGVVLYARP